MEIKHKLILCFCITYMTIYILSELQSYHHVYMDNIALSMGVVYTSEMLAKLATSNVCKGPQGLNQYEHRTTVTG
jgi:hypothetical protein